MRKGKERTRGRETKQTVETCQILVVGDETGIDLGEIEIDWNLGRGEIGEGEIDLW